MVSGFDRTALYFGNGYRINDKIELRQPTIGDIVRVGEERYFSTVHCLTSIPSDAKAALFDLGVDYEEISDLEFFQLMTLGLAPEDSEIFLPGIDFSKFEMRSGDVGLYMYDPDDDIVIDMHIHMIISQFVCMLHGIKKTPELAGNSYTKKILIEEDRDNKERAKGKPREDALFPLISSVRVCMRCSKEEILKMGAFEFMDVVYRTQTIEGVKSLTSAYYSGNLDTKSFDTKKLDAFRDLYKK